MPLLRTCAQKTQSTKFAQCSDCTQFIRIINLSCRINIAQICRLRTLLLSQKIKQTIRQSRKRTCNIAHKFVPIRLVNLSNAPHLHRLNTSGRSHEREDFAHHFSRKLIFLGEIFSQHLLCTSCECGVNWTNFSCIFKKRNPPHKKLCKIFVFSLFFPSPGSKFFWGAAIP